MGKNSKSKARVSEDEEMLSQDEQEDQTEMPNNESSLYQILGVENTATQKEIKKAYHKLALRLHPDKNPGDEEAKEKFQQLQKVISILGDEEKRAVYDQTGCVDDADLAGETAQNLRDYFRTIYKQVTKADIEEFEANYRGSESETKDLKDLYVKFKGNMDRLFCSMICSYPNLESHRFMNTIDEAIAAGELMETKAYKKWAKKISEMEPPTNAPLKKSKSKKKADTDLFAMISSRSNQRKEQFESMFTSIIEKCGGKDKASKSGSEPSKEEFEAVQKRLESQKQSKKGRKK
ncbi:Chaperone protein dnaJ 6 [Ranunculus cassubicifolius]